MALAKKEGADFKEQKLAMVNQQPCRGGFCGPESIKALAGEYAGLNAKFLNYRKGPLTAFITSVALQDRVAEHATRIEDMIKRAKENAGLVLVSSRKIFDDSFQKNKEVFDKVIQDMKGAIERCAGFDSSLTRYAEQIKKKTLSKEDALGYVKSTKITYDKIITDLKANQTKIKTCRLRLPDMQKQVERTPALAAEYKKAVAAFELAEKALASANKSMEGFKSNLVKYNEKVKAMK